MKISEKIKHWWKTYAVFRLFATFLVTSFLGTILYIIVERFRTNSFPDTGSLIITFLVELGVAFVAFVLMEQARIEENLRLALKSHITTEKSTIENILGKAPIVLNIDISPFNYIHIKIIQNIINSINVKEKKIDKVVKEMYALDSSDASKWWGNSALGYFAAQSSQISKPGKKKIHRFFVLDKASLIADRTKKFLQLHILMGFETYIIFTNTFHKLCNEFDSKNEEKLNRKEFFVWDNLDITAFVNVPGKTYGLCHGYQSYWPFDAKERGGTFYDIHGDPKNMEKEEIHFELIETDFANIAKTYINFSKFLIKKAKDCSHYSKVQNLCVQGLEVLKIPLEFNVDDEDEKPEFVDTDVMNKIFEYYCFFHKN